MKTASFFAAIAASALVLGLVPASAQELNEIAVHEFAAAAVDADAAA